jgi:hypothetical protein
VSATSASAFVNRIMGGNSLRASDVLQGAKEAAIRWAGGQARKWTNLNAIKSSKYKFTQLIIANHKRNSLIAKLRDIIIIIHVPFS